jgi:hypothetical protein
LRNAGVPAEVKFLAVFAVAVGASFALGWLVTGRQLVGRIL